jgi:hypothetical protein
LRERSAHALRDHLYSDLDYQTRMARFLENHDEPRAAATFPFDIHKAAAIITYLSPGLRFFHQGQFQGSKKRISPHLVRGPVEPVDELMKSFYASLLHVLRRPVFRNGQWQLLECAPAWDGNNSSDDYVAFAWHNFAGERVIVAVNYAPHHSQCYVRLPFPGLPGRNWKVQDLLSSASYIRNGSDLESRGLYLDVPPWRYHVFELTSTQGT